jgi:hypothetical protein
MARLLISLLAALAAGTLSGMVSTTSAALSGSTENQANGFAAASDWTRPTVSASVIAKTAGGIPGYIRQGGAYHVYANVSDQGNPPSGVATVTADVQTITTGQTVVSLSAGSFPIGGVTYNRRSGSVTANTTLSQGSYTYSITATDAAGNAGTSGGFGVTVDNVRPGGADVQITDGGGTVGRPQQGDVIRLTFTEQIEPVSVVAGWTGSSTNVTVRITNNSTNDGVTIWNSANTAQLPLGSVTLGGDYVTATATFGASGTRSTMVQSGSLITITLGTLNSGTVQTVASNTTMAWTPSSTATDRAGNACQTTVTAEPGTADREF